MESESGILPNKARPLIKLFGVGVGVGEKKLFIANWLINRQKK